MHVYIMHVYIMHVYIMHAYIMHVYDLHVYNMHVYIMHCFYKFDQEIIHAMNDYFLLDMNLLDSRCLIFKNTAITLSLISDSFI